MIVASNLSKRYPGGLDAVKEVSFTIEAGQMVLITGHSGAGKSTLVKLIASIETESGRLQSLIHRYFTQPAPEVLEEIERRRAIAIETRDAQNPSEHVNYVEDKHQFGDKPST